MLDLREPDVGDRHRGPPGDRTGARNRQTWMRTMMADDFEQRCRATIDAYMAAFNAKDLDALGRTLTEDVTLVDWDVSASGRDDVLATTSRIVSGAALHITVRGLLVAEPNAAADIVIAIDGTSDLDVLDLFAFAPDGRIRSIRAFRGPQRTRPR
ncbi:nuclear transport factor 2 family protein [Methylobacterium sp. J-068]|uniref:nuclear transport factor 2 family protein n=1 Tax=Methylobacterium sp. J-068 TaxID=2836649 RepID=UPI001FB952DF|nr:nuclear transport factor 2 family protein [Methylobacterium sp. J-068]MCJ2036215.1 nuclear transport factor 2 family protein [Methylobacterium sp. J-068]